MVKKLRVGGTVSRVGTLFSSHALGGSVYYMRKKCNSLFAGGGGGGGGVAWCTLLGQGNT